MLNRLSSLSDTLALPSDAACFALLKSIFPSLFPSTLTPGRRAQADSPKGSRQRIPAMLGAMREILVRHSRLDFGREIRCMLHRSKNGMDDTLGSISHSQVCRFVTTILKKGFGPTLLGGEDNLRALIKRARHNLLAPGSFCLSWTDGPDRGTPFGRGKTVRVHVPPWAHTRHSSGRVGVATSVSRPANSGGKCQTACSCPRPGPLDL